MEQFYFITAIDTDAGKSVVTGMMAAYLQNKRVKIITQKMAQTGCVGISEDISLHRQWMEQDLFPEDKNGDTCPYLFPFPAAPSFSASLEGEKIDVAKISAAAQRLSGSYSTVLVEGVGGLMVPLTEDTAVIDYLQEQQYPAVLVTHGRLGSINHTLLSLEAMHRREIDVRSLVFNHAFDQDPILVEDAVQSMQRYLSRWYPDAVLIHVNRQTYGDPLPDFSPLFGL